MVVLTAAIASQNHNPKSTSPPCLESLVCLNLLSRPLGPHLLLLGRLRRRAVPGPPLLVIPES